jgi:hypothetical protein
MKYVGKLYVLNIVLGEDSPNPSLPTIFTIFLDY